MPLENYQTYHDEPDLTSKGEGADMITHGHMRGMFYRGEITRELLYQLERVWSNALGRPLTPEDVALAKQREKEEAERLWYWEEERTLPAEELDILSRRRAEELKTQAE